MSNCIRIVQFYSNFPTVFELSNCIHHHAKLHTKFSVLINSSLNFQFVSTASFFLLYAVTAMTFLCLISCVRVQHLLLCCSGKWNVPHLPVVFDLSINVSSWLPWDLFYFSFFVTFFSIRLRLPSSVSLSIMPCCAISPFANNNFIFQSRIYVSSFWSYQNHQFLAWLCPAMLGNVFVV